MEKTMKVAIDGPAGAGKSTIAKIVAKKKEFIYVDTGAMYRALALACIRNEIKSDDEMAVADICKRSDVKLKYENDEQIVMLNGENVNPYIRTEDVSSMTSKISAYPEVREILLDLQRSLAGEYNVVMDGRDIGSNVLPDAQVKIYLTASVETRADRRYREQVERGLECNLEEIKKDIEERDYRDSHRECAPLTVAEGAVVLDSSDMSIEQVVEKMIEIIETAEQIR